MGGIAGGTTITLTGAGFSENGGSGGNRVLIETSPSAECDVIGYLSSYDQIVCITRPRPSSIDAKETIATVKVIVGGVHETSSLQVVYSVQGIVHQPLQVVYSA